ncbi:MAG: hypothetical protein FJ279_16095 [Planctomycetes bacterium]|nr:hypothetical protein [Planctomycetota bacterium]MBM4080575.1 hypothetical protein [Planctomycetota bacterium]
MVDAQRRIESVMVSGERLLWSGQPKGGIQFRAADALLIPFGLVFCGFAIFWEVLALMATAKARGPIAIAFPLFGVPFVLLGLYIVFGRFIVEAKRRERTFYGVTNERAIIISGLLSQSTKSLNLRTLSDITLSERSDGSGSITFGPTHPFGWPFQGTSWPGGSQYTSPCFDLIPNAREVYDVLRKAQRESPGLA